MSLQANSLKDGWTLAKLAKSQILIEAHKIRKQAAKLWKCKVTEILLSVCVEMARKGEKLKVVKEVVKKTSNKTAKVSRATKTAARPVYDEQLDLFSALKDVWKVDISLSKNEKMNTKVSVNLTEVVSHFAKLLLKKGK